MLLMSYIEAIDQLTILYLINTIYTIQIIYNKYYGECATDEPSA